MKIKSNLYKGNSDKLARKLNEKYQIDTEWLKKYKNVQFAVVFKLTNQIHITLFNEHMTTIGRGTVII